MDKELEKNNLRRAEEASLVNAARALWGFAVKALFSGGEGCAVCGKIDSAVARCRFRLCATCRIEIPWIVPDICEDCGRPMGKREHADYAEHLSHADYVDFVDYVDNVEQANKIRCRDCERNGARSFVMNRSAVKYVEPFKSWLALYKYRGLRRVEKVLLAILKQAYLLHYRELQFDVVTYVPLHHDRLQERGFNQAEQMAKGISRAIGCPVRPLLKRVKATEKQSQRERQDRLNQLRGVFAAEDGALPVEPIGNAKREPRKITQFGKIKKSGDMTPSGRPDEIFKFVRILLIDDVYTTGSTVEECARILREKWGAEIYILTLAR